MDDNVMRVLQLLQDGKISAQEAEMLIAALRGESTAASEPAEEPEPEEKDEKPFFTFPDKMKTPKFDLDNLGERISKAISKIEPEKIVRKVQAQLREASKSSVNWSATVSAKVRNWSDGDDTRPENSHGLPEHEEEHEQEFHLDQGAAVLIENPLGDVKVTGIYDGPASVHVTKTAWAGRSEEAKAASDSMVIDVHGTDTRLDIKTSSPDSFHDGIVDIELKIPRSSNVRVSTRFGDLEIHDMDGRSEGVTTSGDANLHDLSGDARVETVSGDIEIARIGGAANAATQSGDIELRQIAHGVTAGTASGDVHAVQIEGGRIECKSVSGDVHVEEAGQSGPVDIVVESVSGDAHLSNASGTLSVKAVSGDASVENVAATRLQAQTVSGDVHVRMREPFSGNMQVNTVSGDVNLGLKVESRLRVSLSTTSGDLRCDLDAHDVTASETLWTGQIGDGSGTLNVQTISGDTRIERA